MKLFITGGTGFLGQHIAKKLIGIKQFSVIMPSQKSLDLCNRDDVLSQLRTIHFGEGDIILHMAAICGGILANKNSPADFLHKNVDMASNIFHAAKEVGCKKIYTLGSVCAYPKFCPVPFKEDNLWDGYPEETNAPYGMAKRLQLMMGQTYRQQYGIGGGHFIPVNMYGEYDHFDLVNSHVIPALIRKFDDAKKSGAEQVSCWGTGEATREFLYAGDAADAIIDAILMNFDSPLPVNLGTGRDISIKNLAYLIKELVGCDSRIHFSGDVSDGQPMRKLDVSRAQELLNWRAKTTLECGLKRTIEWYQANLFKTKQASFCPI